MQATEERECLTIINQGKKIFGIMHRPVDVNGPIPAVVICPGFAGNKAGKYRIFVSMAQELAKNKIAVLRFDYRGAGDSEGDFSELTINTQVSDALACLNLLKKDSRIDSSKIGLLGRSLGGMVSVLAANQFSELKSLALWAPVFSGEPWKKLLSTFSSASAEALKQGALPHLPPAIPSIPGVGFLKEFFQVDLKKELSKIHHIPLLHVHGKQDEFVKFEQALEYEQACRANERVRFIHLPHSNHDFSNEEERQIAISETCQWFRQTLLT